MGIIQRDLQDKQNLRAVVNAGNRVGVRYKDIAEHDI